MNAVRASSVQNQWHSLHLASVVVVVAPTVAAGRSSTPPTWSLDPTRYHIGKYLLIKTKAPHKPKLKNITPTAVETALGADAPWTATSTPASTGRCRYFVHV